MILIRADGDDTIGLGHVIRMSAIVQAAQDLDEPVTVVVSACPTTVTRQYEQDGATVRHINDDIGSAEDAKSTLSIANEVGATIVVCDGYRFTSDYLNALHSPIRTLAVLDDTATHPVASCVDVVINVNAGAERLRYKAPSTAVLLLGSTFALLRRQFQQQSHNSSRYEHLLVTLGGGEARALLDVLATGIAGTRFHKTVTYVVSPADHEWLEQRVDTTNTTVLSNVKDMASVMANADLAVCAAGGTSWELACMGVPMLQILRFDNQIVVYETLQNRGVTIPLGSADDLTPTRFQSALDRALEHPDILRQCAEAGHELIDGRGAHRVVTALRAHNVTSTLGAP